MNSTFYVTNLLKQKTCPQKFQNRFVDVGSLSKREPFCATSDVSQTKTLSAILNSARTYDLILQTFSVGVVMLGVD